MKVGDLVRFSTYGTRLLENVRVAEKSPVGVVVTISGRWFYVHWAGITTSSDGWKYYYTRRDLKHAK